jgi:outer membrane protein TolC
MPERRPVSLADCIQTALEHNLDLQIQRQGPAIARFGLNASLGAYDAVLTFTATRTLDNFPYAPDPKKVNPDFEYEQQGERFSPGLAGRLPTGLTYRLGASSDFFKWRGILPPADFPPDGIRRTNQYFGAASINLRQPLLRDFWIDASRQEISIEKKNLKISELSLRQEIINVVTKVQLAYYDLIAARDQVGVQRQALELAEELLKQTRKRVEVGDLPPLDEKQAEAQVETTRADLLAAQQTVNEKQNALKTLMTDDYQRWSDVDLEPTESLGKTLVPIDRDASWQTALAQRPDVLQFRLELEKRNVTVCYQRNQLFPSLDLVGSYGGRAVRGTFGTMIEDLEDGRAPAYSYGVVLSLPLSNRSARNAYKASQAARKQAELQLKRLEQEVLVQVDNAAKLALSQFKRVNSTHQARVYAEAALAAEQTKLEAGASTSFVVLQLQRALTDARSAEIRALTDYNKALVQLAFSDGSTLEKNLLSVDLK